MEKLREAANTLINDIQNFIAEFVREKEVLVEKNTRLSEYDENLKAREVAVASVEQGEKAKEAQETRKTELLGLQKEISAGSEDLERQKKAFAEDKDKWTRQKEADQKGIDNDRQDIRNQNAALAKEKAEYKDKVLKKIKAGVEV